MKYLRFVRSIALPLTSRGSMLFLALTLSGGCLPEDPGTEDSGEGSDGDSPGIPKPESGPGGSGSEGAGSTSEGGGGSTTTDSAGATTAGSSSAGSTGDDPSETDEETDEDDETDDSTSTPGGSDTEPEEEEEEEEEPGATPEDEEEPSPDDEESEEPSPDKPAKLQGILVTPFDRIVEIDLRKFKRIKFKAQAIYDDGSRKDITDEVAWKAEKEEVGHFEENSLRLKSHKNVFAETSKVTASFGGVTGWSQITVVSYQKDGDDQDFFFLVPYKGDKKSDKLAFETSVSSMDVFFNVDTTSSMRDEMQALQSSLSGSIIPSIKKDIKDTRFGVGAVQDFPIKPFGEDGSNPVAPLVDQPFRLLQKITKSESKAQDGVNALALGSGGDYPESIIESLYQIATGKGLNGPGKTSVDEHTKGVGGAGFRKGTLPVVVTVTDAATHAPGENSDSCGRDYNSEINAVAHTREETHKALEKICARAIYVASEGGTTGECDPIHDGARLSKATGSRVSPAVWGKSRPKGCDDDECCTGKGGVGVKPDKDGMCPLVYRVDKKGKGLGDTIISGIKSLAFYSPFTVETQTEGGTKSTKGVELPSGKTILDFIDSIKPDSAGKPPLPGLPDPSIKGDKFENVTPGTEVKFKIKAYNDFVKQKVSGPQVFMAKVSVNADQCEGLELDTRNLIFVVPPKPMAPPQ